MKIRELKQDMSMKMELWAAEVAALKAHLDLNLALAVDRVESVKTELSGVLEKLKARIVDEKAMMAESREHLIENIEHLRVQMALAKAETRDSYRDQKLKLHQAIENLEKSLDSIGTEVSDGLRSLKVEFARRTHALEVEFDAFDLHFVRGIEHAQENVQKRKEELRRLIHDFQSSLAHKSESAGKKAEELERRLEHGVEKVRGAFKRTFAMWGRVGIDGETDCDRERMIREAAYFRAEKRGFSGGDPVKDWVSAEAEVDAALSPQPDRDREARQTRKQV